LMRNTYQCLKLRDRREGPNGQTRELAERLGKPVQEASKQKPWNDE
jgi:hypothetical protein